MELLLLVFVAGLLFQRLFKIYLILSKDLHIKF